MDILGIGAGYVYSILKQSGGSFLTLPAEWLTQNIFSQPWIKSIYDSVRNNIANGV